MGSSFNEPATDDTTSAPPEPNPVAQILKKKKKIVNVRNSGELAGAIARAKRARQTGQKYG